jgi:excisionase family DNA binding protein
VPDEYLTVAEIAAELKPNDQTIRNLIDRGDLPAVRVGTRRVRVLRSDLDAFLAEGRRLTTRSDARVAFHDAMGAANKALRGGDNAEAVTALRSLSDAAVALADELDGNEKTGDHSETERFS